MRTITGSNITAQQQPVVNPTVQLLARDETLHFGLAGVNGTGTLDASVPQSFAMRPTGVLAYAAYRHTDGTAYLRVIDTTAPSDYVLATASATTISCQSMRNAVINEGGTMRLYCATHGVGGVQVRRATLTGTSNPVTASLVDYGPLISESYGLAYVDSADLVRRVEAVCPTDGGGVVVCVGTHDFAVGMSTLQFYWLPDGSTVVPLNTLIQMPLGGVYASWHQTAKHCTFVSAIYNSENGSTHVFVNDQVHGRAVSFYIKNGIESALLPVAPISSLSSLVTLLACSPAKINGVYYLTARFERRVQVSDSVTKTTIGFDLYLQSSDCINWSLGERSSFLCTATAYGALLMRSDSPSAIYYGGNGRAYAAAVTQLQSPGASASVTLDDYVQALSIDETADAGDRLALELVNPSTALGGAAWDGNAHVRRGGTLVLSVGYDGNVDEYARYNIDDLSKPVTPIDGGQTGVLAVEARDAGQKRLIDYNLPIEADLRGRLETVTKLGALDALSLKTPEVDLKATSVGWRYDGLNDPVIAYADCEEDGDALMEATVQMDGADAYHVASIGFVFGADENGNGNVMLLPKANSWTLFGTASGPAVRKLALKDVDPTDPDKDDTGWNFTERVNGLWLSAISSGQGGPRTASLSGTYRTGNAFALTPGTRYDVAVRVSGKRVQIFTKQRVAAASWAANAHYTLQAEFLFDYRTRRSQPGADYCGLALSHDVAASTAIFASAAANDVEQTLTWAKNNALLNDYTVLFATGSTESPSNDKRDIGSLTTTAGLVVGEYVRLNIPTHSNQILRIESLDSSSIRFTTPYSLSGTPGGVSCQVYRLATADVWGWADCGKQNVVATSADELGDLLIPIDPKAKKMPRAVRGRGIFITDDNTAASIRMLSTDGARFGLYSGGEAGSRVAWDPTNPIAKNDDYAFFYGGSAPAAWRVILHHGHMFDGAASQFGIPASGYLIVDDELMRYGEFSFYKRGMTAQNKWTIVPTYYAPLAAAGGPTATIRNWRSSLGAQPGDDLGDIPSVAGMLVEIVSKNGGSIGTDDKQYYATGQHKETSPTVDTTSYITLDTPYENDVRGSDPSIVLSDGTINPALTPTQKEGDLAVVSGRGQFGTKKNTHAADAPVLYAPVDSSGVRPLITVSRFAVMSGRYQALEDAIKQMAALGGQRAVNFRNYMTGANKTAAWMGNLSTVPASMPLVADVVDFVLTAKVHIPGNNTNANGTAGITSERRLNIFFRNYYRLSIQQYATAADYAAGRGGAIRIGLATTSTDITADGAGERWLKTIPIPDTDYNVSGTVSGSTPNFTLTEDVARIVDLMVAVQGGRVVVEINEKPMFTFDLDDLYDVFGSASYRKDTSGPVMVGYTGTVPSYTASVRVLELGEEVARYTAQKGSSASSNLATLTRDRHVRGRSAQGGAVEFSRFWQRDDLGTLSENHWQHVDGQSDVDQRGHIAIEGNETMGETLDEVFVATEGYRFGSASNEMVMTPEAGAAEAALVMRSTAESAFTDEIAAAPLLQAQPEDKLTLAYFPEVSASSAGVPIQDESGASITDTTSDPIASNNEPAGDRPTYAPTDHVISTKRTTIARDDAGTRTYEANYTLRGYRA